MHTNFEVPSFTYYKDVKGPQNSKTDHVTVIKPIWRLLAACCLWSRSVLVRTSSVVN